jgi:hypothetical protein
MVTQEAVWVKAHLPAGAASQGQKQQKLKKREGGKEIIQIRRF